jgi:hypothetical protein
MIVIIVFFVLVIVIAAQVAGICIVIDFFLERAAGHVTFGIVGVFMVGIGIEHLCNLLQN